MKNHSAFRTSQIGLLKRMRLHNATEPLEQTELPIAMVAQSAGYQSERIFHKLSGPGSTWPPGASGPDGAEYNVGREYRRVIRHIRKV